MEHARPRPQSVQWLLDPEMQCVPDLGLGRREEAEESRRSGPRLFHAALAASAVVIIGGGAYLALPMLEAEFFDSAPTTSPVALNDAPVLTVGPLNSEPQAPAPIQAATPPPAPAPVPPRPVAVTLAMPLPHPIEWPPVTPPPEPPPVPPQPVAVMLAMPLPHPIDWPPVTPPPAPSPMPPAPVAVTLAMPLPHPIDLLPPKPPAAPSPAPPHPVAVALAMPLPHPIEWPPVTTLPPDKPAAIPPPPARTAVSQVLAVRAAPPAPKIPRAADLHFNVRLSFTANEATRATTFAHALRQQGFAVTSIAIPATLGRWPGVAYFYESDRDKALFIARQLTALTGTHQHARLSPRHPYPGPGTVEVSLLGDARPKSRGPDKQSRTKRLS